MRFYTVEDRVLDAYVIHKHNTDKEYTISKSVLSKKLSVYIHNARKVTTNKANPALSAYYFSYLIIHVDEITGKIFYVKFTDETLMAPINHKKIRYELNQLGINRKGNDYKKSYYSAN